MTKVVKGRAYAKALLSELKVSGPTDARNIAAQLQLDVSELDVQGFDGGLVRAKGTPIGATSSEIRSESLDGRIHCGA